jgi:WhiB family redox-sensing transcriptional regulator
VAVSVNGETWWQWAACLDTDIDVFFPEEGDDEDGLEEPLYVPAEAKAICTICPVRSECLNYALTVQIIPPGKAKPEWVKGIWGGTTTYLRELMRRRQDRKSCPNCHSRDVLDERGDQICQSCGASWPASY